MEMTITFLPHRGQSMSHEEQQYVRKIFSDLNNKMSYYTSLQLLYNNGEHFQTTTSNMCHFPLIKNLACKAVFTQQTIYVEGTIHKNYHVSNVIQDQDGNGVFCEDSYIKVLDTNGDKLHILIKAPVISTTTPIYIHPQTGCQSMFMISPIFEPATH
jgi:hypothetical protein